jgi:hypothetical protein
MTKATNSTSTPARAAPHIPTSQERGDDLLQRWRLARAAGIPAEIIMTRLLDDCFAVVPR